MITRTGRTSAGGLHVIKLRFDYWTDNIEFIFAVWDRKGVQVTFFWFFLSLFKVEFEVRFGYWGLRY
jgi:hypothetical protein